MLKPFYNKKKNIDDRLVPEVSVADAGKVLGVTEEGKIAAVEAGGGHKFISLPTLTGVQFLQLFTGTSITVTISDDETPDIDAEDLPNTSLILKTDADLKPEIYCTFVMKNTIGSGWGSFVVESQNLVFIIVISRNYNSPKNQVIISATQIQDVS